MLGVTRKFFAASTGWRHFGVHFTTVRTNIVTLTSGKRNWMFAINRASSTKEHIIDQTEIENVLPEIVEVLTTEGYERDCQNARDWFKKVFDYTVSHTKKVRRPIVVNMFKCFASKESATNENVQLAAILDWCVEMFFSSIAIIDDIMDQSEIRSCKPCWYRINGVGFQAFNDAMSIENAIYILLKRYFRNKDYYVDLYELFTTITKQTVKGQTLDLVFSANDGEINLGRYTPEHLNVLVKYKTVPLIFRLPVASGIYVAGCSKGKIEEVEPLLLSLGRYYHAQNDYMDCYGNSEITGLIGSDIESGKCSWLMVTALELANESQKRILAENYGRANTMHVTKVKAVFDELDLAKVYQEYEESLYKEISTMINELPQSTLVTVFEDYLNQLRNK